MSTADGSAPAAAPTPAEPHTPPSDVAHPRAIRTCVVRAGRTTIGQARALAELGPRYLLPYDPTTTDLVAACARRSSAEGHG